MLIPLLVVQVFTLSGCFKDKTETQTLRHAIPDDIVSVDPAVGYDLLSSFVVLNIYETLYEYSYTHSDGKIVPLLAADIPSYSKDGLTITIPIKRGVHFQDDPNFKATNAKGRELKASDFVYSFNRIKSPTLKSPGSFLFHFVEKVTAIDDYSLQIRLRNKYESFLHLLTLSFTAPVAHEVVDAYSDLNGEIKDRAVGTGPFVLKKWNKGKNIILEQNTNYHPCFYPSEGSNKLKKAGHLEDYGKRIPFLEQIVFSIIRDTEPLVEGVNSGSIDLVKGLDDEKLKNRTENRAEDQVDSYYLIFNMDNEIVGKRRSLRRGISASISRTKWIDLLSNSRGKKQTSLFSSNNSGTTFVYDYNITEAKELLKKAGFRGVEGVPALTLDLPGSDNTNRMIGEFFKHQLNKVGLKIEPVYNSFGSFFEKLRTKDFQIAYMGSVPEFQSAEAILMLFYGPFSSPGPNLSNFRSHKFDRLFEKLQGTSNLKERDRLMALMEKIVLDQVPWVLGYSLSDKWAVQPWVKNFKADSYPLAKHKYLRIIDKK